MAVAVVLLLMLLTWSVAAADVVVGVVVGVGVADVLSAVCVARYKSPTAMAGSTYAKQTPLM